MEANNERKQKRAKNSSRQWITESSFLSHHHKNIDLIKILELEEYIYEVIDNVDFLDIVKGVINTNEEFTKYTDIDKQANKELKQKTKKIKPF